MRIIYSERHQRLAKVIGHVTSYSSLLTTNGLAWLHLRRIDEDGVVWLHSSPISVVKKAGRGKHTVDEAGIDICLQPSDMLLEQ